MLEVEPGGGRGGGQRAIVLKGGEVGEYGGARSVACWVFTLF